MRNFNEMVFKNKKQAMQLISLLLDVNADDMDFYQDIHIKQEDDYILIQWSDVAYNGGFGGQFKFVDEGQYIVDENEDGGEEDDAD